MSCVQPSSWLKFLQGSAWFWKEEYPQQLNHLEFNPHVINDFLRQTAVHESAWMEYFAQTGVRPHTVTYEDLVTSYEETAVEILDYLGIERPSSLAFGE